MGRVVVLVVALALAACSTTPTKVGEQIGDPVEFDIHWLEGKPTLRSTHLREDFQRHTSFGPLEAEIVLILVPSKGTQKELEQRRELNKVDSEARTIIGVIADLSGMREDWYSVDVETAERLYQGRSRSFHILLLDSDGRLLKESTEVLPAEVIRQYFPLENEAEGNKQKNGCQQARQNVLDQYGIPDNVVVIEGEELYTQHWNYRTQGFAYVLRETLLSGECHSERVKI